MAQRPGEAGLGARPAGAEMLGGIAVNSETDATTFVHLTLAFDPDASPSAELGGPGSKVPITLQSMRD
jgi:hypothetical protein